jgi:hypothetical protein
MSPRDAAAVDAAAADAAAARAELDAAKQQLARVLEGRAQGAQQAWDHERRRLQRAAEEADRRARDRAAEAAALREREADAEGALNAAVAKAVSFFHFFLKERQLPYTQCLVFLGPSHLFSSYSSNES